MRAAYLKIVAVAAVLTLAGFGCQPETTSQVLLTSPDGVPGQIAPAVSKTIARSFGSDVTMALNGSFDYKDGLHMELVKVSDTKCPTGATCSFEGELSPLIRLTGGAIGSETKEVTLTWESNKIARLNGYIIVLEGATTTTARVTVNKAAPAPGAAVANAKPDPKTENPSSVPVTTTKPELVEVKANTQTPPSPAPQVVADNSFSSRMRSSWLIRWLFGDPELRQQQAELERQAAAATTTPVVTTTTVPKTTPKPVAVVPTQQLAGNNNPATPPATPTPPSQTTNNGTQAVNSPANNAPPPTQVEPAPAPAAPVEDTQPKTIISTFVDAVTTVVRTVVDAITGGNETETASLPSSTGEAIEIIRIAGPNANQVIGSPVIIDGEARGSWFNNGKFPVKLIDANGKVLAVSEAQAIGDSSSANAFVKYELHLNFEMATAPTGILILFKGTGEATDSQDPAISIPIRFGEYSKSVPAQ